MVEEAAVTPWAERFPIGRAIVSMAFALMVLAMVLDWPAWLVTVFQAGFIGGFTNTVAIYMLFTEAWYLPGSGVLLKRKDAIIRTLANTMEAHILNPSLIEDRVRAISKNIDPERVLAGLNNVVDELRGEVIAFISAPEQKLMITQAVRQEGGFLADMAHASGIITYDDVAERIQGGLIKQAQQFRLSHQLLDAATHHVGTLEDFLLEPGNPLIRRHYGSEQSVAHLLFEKLDARQMVIEKLSRYEAEQIRDIVSESIKEHLAWLEVFGVILGMLIALGTLAATAIFGG